MLQELNIKNLAIIDHIEVNFEDHMTVLTGETGAGKSIVMDAIGLLAGGRGSKSLIRSGADKLVLQGQFIFPADGLTYRLLDELGIDHDDGSVILQREITQNGRNVCRVNGMLVNTNTLKRIGQTIVDIEGQHDHQELLQPERHLHLLDEFIGKPIKTILESYQHYYRRFKKLKQLVEDKNNNQQQWAQHIDMLQFQVNEINAAELQPNEEDELVKERDQLLNHQKISDALKGSFVQINGDETISPLDMIGDAMNSMQSIEQYDDSYQAISEDLQNAYYALQDASNQISRETDLQEFDENRLADIEARLDLIYQLKRKYGDSIEKILNYYQKISKELKQTEADQSDSNDLDEQLLTVETKLQQLGEQMSSLRHQSAVKLEGRIHQQLADLYMEQTRFEVSFTPNATHHFTSNGIEAVAFYIQTNPGEGFHELAKIASGGELSRIMLALKTIFVSAQGVTSIIFDEVDTGVSGRVAQAMAEKISAIAETEQVLCITHLPQVAAIGDHHYFIGKQVINNRTKTTIQKLDHDQQVTELSRMLAGKKVTKLTLEHADEMLKMASEKKHV
ncbi:DNA repair protein RecN [Nicoliella spurrieriana]|uniref:DNA repair protein RecN n=1 Tax=Nicoliella spurrieriana TaxID=2925830 RepID=A0A976RRS7_9LACO|nr:DNA repair protein RecN [Nicoliella spurrieriana]UQS86647.1 DNA repair protein RecN [Nicoliella spurrieriana]